MFGKGPTIEYEMTNVDCPLDRGDIFISGEKNIGQPGGVIVVPSYRGKNAYRFETMSAMPIEDKVAMSMVVVGRQGITAIQSNDKIIQIKKTK